MGTGPRNVVTFQPLPIEDHNSFYAHESWKLTPKEYYKFVAGQAAPDLLEATRVLDVGCANGDFLYYLSWNFPRLQLSGCDVSPNLLAVAEKSVPAAQFFFADIAGDVSKLARHDVVFMMGVNYLLPHPETWIKALLLLAPIAYIFGQFNPDPLDVRATVSRPGAYGTISWNLISRMTIGAVANTLGFHHSFTPWSLPLALPRIAGADPTRSWTIDTAEGEHLVVDGTQVIRRYALLRISS